MVIMILCGLLFINTSFLVKEKSIKKYLTFIILVLAIVGFFVKPTSEMDLYRHHITLNNLRTLGFNNISKDYNMRNLPIYALYFYTISLLKFNGFLMFFTTIIVYGIMFYVLYKLSKDQNLGHKRIMYSVCFLLSTLSYLNITGIRQILAFSIFCLAIYLEFIRRKKVNGMILYFLPIFLHTSSIVTVMLRIIKPKNKIIIKKIILIIAFFWSGIYYLLIPIFERYSHIGLFSLFLEQINFYTLRTYFEPVRFILTLLTLLGISICFYYTKRNITSNKSYNKEIINMFLFLELILSFTWGGIFYYDIFVRFTMLITILMVLILPFFYSLKKTERMIIIHYILMAVSLINIVYNFRYAYTILYF